MKRVLLTGGTGFVGANLAHRLVAEGHQTHLLVRPGFSPWRIESILDRVTLHEVNVCDADRVKAALGRIEPAWIFHLAAHGAYSWETDAEQITRTNVVGTKNLIGAALDTGVEMVVNTGSSSEYGRQDHAPLETEPATPDTPYGIAKAAATAMCVDVATARGARVCTLRLYSVYGPYEDPRRLLPSLIVHGRRGMFPPLVSAATARDFVFVDDVVDAYLAAARHTSVGPGAIYNVGTGVQTTIGAAVEVARRVLAIPGEPQWGRMPPRVWDTDTWVADSRKIRAELGWAPRVTFAEGFERMALWLDRHPELRDRYEAAWP
jgi:nucleoside-diphosphate-sugar epimerase